MGGPTTKTRMENLPQDNRKRKRKSETVEHTYGETRNISVVEEVQAWMPDPISGASNDRPPLALITSEAETPEASEATAVLQSTPVKAPPRPLLTGSPLLATPPRSKPARSFKRIDSEEIIPSSQEPSQYPLAQTHPHSTKLRLPDNNLPVWMFHSLNAAHSPSDEIIPDSQAISPRHATTSACWSIQGRTPMKKVAPSDEDHGTTPSSSRVFPKDEEVVPSSQTQLMTAVYSPLQRRSHHPTLLDYESRPNSPLSPQKSHYNRGGSPTQEDSYAPWVKSLLERVGHGEDQGSSQTRRNEEVEGQTNWDPAVGKAEGDWVDGSMADEGKWESQNTEVSPPSSTRSIQDSKDSTEHKQLTSPSSPSTPRVTLTGTLPYAPSGIKATPASEFSFDMTRIEPSQYPELLDGDSYALPSESFFDGLARCLQDDSDSD
ncbi:hypothetical protein FRB95_013358 [Tulasnella sp. JGI-2019a]|nr:hypothetical protein FRB95_013358 [Tulasnella sp. JGI-2019a]